MKVSSRLSEKRKKTKVLVQMRARAQAPSEGHIWLEQEWKQRFSGAAVNRAGSALIVS